MKACVYEKAKESASLVLRDITAPVPGAGEVLIRVISTGLNAADYRSAQMGIIPRHRIFGADVAGIVEAVGANVTTWRVGDEVTGDLSGVGFGGLAEYVTAPEKALSRKPSTVDFDTVAALPLASVTALQGIRNSGLLQKGQSVLICGAGGGVGTYAVQLCRYFGADVTALCGPANVDRIQALGAGKVVDYTKTDLKDLPAIFDLVLLINGAYSSRQIRKLMKPQAICVTIGGAISHVMKTMFFSPFLSIGKKKFRLLSAKPNGDDLSFILQLVEKGEITPVIDRKIPLAEAPEAFRYLRQGHSRGKIVVQISEATSQSGPTVK